MYPTSLFESLYHYDKSFYFQHMSRFFLRSGASFMARPPLPSVLNVMFANGRQKEKKRRVKRPKIVLICNENMDDLY